MNLIFAFWQPFSPHDEINYVRKQPRFKGHWCPFNEVKIYLILTIRALLCLRFHASRNGRFYGLIRSRPGSCFWKRSPIWAYFHLRYGLSYSWCLRRRINGGKFTHLPCCSFTILSLTCCPERKTIGIPPPGFTLPPTK